MLCTFSNTKPGGRSLKIKSQKLSRLTRYRLVLFHVLNFTLKQLLPNVRFYDFANMQYAYTYKILFSLVCLMLPFIKHPYFSMRIFYAQQKIKYRHGVRIFHAYIKKFFLRHDVTRFHSVVVTLLAFETFNVCSVLTKIKL